jgi:hypothetical protein
MIVKIRADVHWPRIEDQGATSQHVVLRPEGSAWYKQLLTLVQYGQYVLL